MGHHVTQRGSCRSICLVALAALLSGGLAACSAQSGAASSSATPTSSATSTTTPPPALQFSITFLHMVDAENGWAAGPASVLHSTDGGTHWLLVTPPGCSSATANIGAASALDAANLWFICAQGNTTGSLVYSLYHTSTGGQRWQSTPLTPASPTVSLGGLTFADPTHGWLADWQGSATGHHFMTLYRTTDGGATWSQAAQTDRAGGLESAALSDGPVFRNDTTGWFSSAIGNYTTTPNQFALSVTHDGGSTWQQQTLPPPQGAVTGPTSPPVCFDAGHCAIILPTSGAATSSATTPPPAYLLIYDSDNGGQTWTPQPLVQMQVLRAAFRDPQHGWALVNPNPPGVSACSSPAAADSRAAAVPASAPQPNVLEGTTDGGQHWTALNSSVNWCDLTALDFVSPQQGWALLGSSGATTTLLRTTDGGLTWATLPWQSA